MVALERKGYIVRNEMKSRAIVLVEEVHPATLGTLAAVRWATWDEMPAPGALIVVRGHFDSLNLTPPLPGMVRRGRYLYVLANAVDEVITMLRGFGFREWTLGPV